MASFDDLGRALRDDAAANAPRASAIDVDAVTRSARARRRPRQWALGALSIVAVLGVGGLAVAAVTPPVLIAASESADLESGAAEESAPLADGGGEADQRVDEVELIDVVGCGAAEPGIRTDDLALDVRLPTSAPSGGDPIVATAALVNEGASTRTLTTGSTVVAVLTQTGAVVGTELPRDDSALQVELAPGESLEVRVVISVVDCRGTGTEPLAPGIYGVTAVLDVVETSTGERSLVVAPDLEIRLD